MTTTQTKRKYSNEKSKLIKLNQFKVKFKLPIQSTQTIIKYGDKSSDKFALVVSSFTNCNSYNLMQG